MKIRHLLIVEDISSQREALRLQFQQSGWQISVAVDGEDALYRYQQAQEMNDPIEAVLTDLGLPPGVDNPWRAGIPLVHALRTQQESLPILAYTSLPPRAMSFAKIVAELLPRRVSFIYLRGKGEVDLPHLLNQVWEGFFILSPVPADFLPWATACEPDPLTVDHWQTIRLLSQGLGHKEVARELGTVGRDAIKTRVAKIKEVLIDAGMLTSAQPDTQDVLDWYRAHHVRYRRE